MTNYVLLTEKFLKNQLYFWMTCVQSQMILSGSGISENILTHAILMGTELR